MFIGIICHSLAHCGQTEAPNQRCAESGYKVRKHGWLLIHRVSANWLCFRFRLTKDGKGFVLYSVGADGKDDGGDKKKDEVIRFP